VLDVAGLTAQQRIELVIRQRGGLRLTDFDGSEKKLGPGQLALSEDPVSLP